MTQNDSTEHKAGNPIPPPMQHYISGPPAWAVWTMIGYAAVGLMSLTVLPLWQAISSLL